MGVRPEKVYDFAEPHDNHEVLWNLYSVTGLLVPAEADPFIVIEVVPIAVAEILGFPGAALRVVADTEPEAPSTVPDRP